jgi:hypothetical protein
MAFKVQRQMQNYREIANFCDENNNIKFGAAVRCKEINVTSLLRNKMQREYPRAAHTQISLGPLVLIEM